MSIVLLAALFASPASAARPTVKAIWASEVTATAFRARAILDTANLTTTYRFDYIPLATYEANVAAGQDGFNGALHIPVGSEAKAFAATTDEEVAQRIAGLTADTSYRYRLVAKNSSGEAIGPERTVTTQESAPSFAVAESRGWELVSPVDKNGGWIAEPETLFGGGDLQAAAQGGAVTYGSASSFAAANGAPGASQYLSSRSPLGWETRNLTLATEAGAFAPEPDGAPDRLFASDLATALVLTQPHSFSLLDTAAAASVGVLAGPDLRFAGATPDLSRIGFSTCAALTADATEVAAGAGCDPAAPNLYIDGEGELRLVNLEPGESQGTPDAALAAQAGAIFNDGSRVYWTDHEGRLMVRDANRTLAVDPEGTFEMASGDGAIAYFTKAAHLYRYSLQSQSSTDLTPSGGVVGVLGGSSDGAYLYYLDGSGLQLWHGGTTKRVAADADPSNYPPATGTARVSADGTRLAFLSDAVLAGYDPEGVSEVYRYDATAGSLLCVSCNPTGARPLGPSSIPGAVANGTEVRSYKPRAMDAAGTRIFFNSEDNLVPFDSNHEPDVYEWRAQGTGGCASASGCVGLISSGKGADGSIFVDAAADGTDAFFLADDSLVSSDPGSVDLYDARIGGGFPQPPAPIPCFGDACQPLPAEPEDPTPGTLFYGSEAKPSPRLPGARKKKHRKRRQHRKKQHRHRRTGAKAKHRSALR